HFESGLSGISRTLESSGVGSARQTKRQRRRLGPGESLATIFFLLASRPCIGFDCDPLSMRIARRSFFVLLVSISAFLSVTPLHGAATKRPNILFITVDDMSCDSVGVFG